MTNQPKNGLKSHFVNLHNYQIIKEINRGGFGIVYLIENKTTHQRLAAKVNINQCESIEETNKFISREIGVLIRVQAPTIIRFHGFSLQDFREDSNVTILMEYKENGSLRQLIDKESKSQSPPNYDNTAKQIILCGIAHGMMILHSRRVLHRDLKPENVLLDENLYPTITDFGLSKFLDPNNSKSQSMSGCGTAAYMSPEVISDTHYTTKSDVYSFGILMFEVITGERAYSELYRKRNFNPLQIITRTVNGERPQIKTPIKASFRKLLERCWSSDPHQRPTFRELFQKLSLSIEEDDETIESNVRDIISEKDENEEDTKEGINYLRYCLDYVDTDKLFDYLDEITKSDSKKEELQDIIEEQRKQMKEVEERTQQEISKLTAANLENQRIINELKTQNQQNQKKIQELKTLHQQNQKEIQELKTQNQQNQKEIQELKTQNQRNPLEGLTIFEIKKRIEEEKSTEITIPSSVTSIGDDAFSGCSSLTQITIPSSVTSIGNRAFSGCSSLTQITIPSSVTSIGNGAFSYCSSLKRITIPSSVTSIGEYAFSGCSSLTQITIPSSVTSIGSNAFSNCSSLTQITIPSSVTSIGDVAFSNCSSLTQITIPSSVTSIGDYAFSGSNLPASIKKQLILRFGSKVF